MKNVIVIFAILVLTGVVPVSCCIDSCGCGGPPEQKHFRVISMEAKAIDRDMNEIDLQSFHPYHNLALLLSPAELEYVFLEDFVPRGSFISGAMACDPPAPAPAHEVSSIRIVATEEAIYANENKSIQNGQDITELFRVGASYSMEGQTVEEFLDGPSTFDLGGLKVMLDSGPVVDTELAFQIAIEFDNNTVFYFTERLKIYH